MSENLEIAAKNGKVYKDFRAFHIAIGHTIRQALIDFYQDIKQYAIKEISNYYSLEFHGSEFYDNTYGMIEALLDSDDVNGAITYRVKGNWENDSSLNVIINWEYLEASAGENGMFWGTYTSLNGESVTDIWEDILEAGLPKGIIYKTGERHPSFNLEEKINNYIDKNIKRIVDDVVKKF